MPEQTPIQKLQAALSLLPVSKQDFARSMIRRANFRPPSDKEMFWIKKLADEATQPAPAPVVAANIGSLAGITALFDTAKQHLKFPAIVMSVPAANCLIRINVAGPSAKFPGSLNVTSGEKPGEDRRAWYGRVQKSGAYEPSGAASAISEAVSARLIEFAADPARIAAEHGRLTGRCCFCNIALSDERSTAVGYGKICAKHYGLPWGD